MPSTVLRPFHAPDNAKPLLTLFSMQVTQSDTIEDQENSEDTLARLGSRSGASSLKSHP